MRKRKTSKLVDDGVESLDDEMTPSDLIWISSALNSPADNVC